MQFKLASIYGFLRNSGLKIHPTVIGRTTDGVNGYLLHDDVSKGITLFIGMGINIKSN